LGIDVPSRSRFAPILALPLLTCVFAATSGGSSAPATVAVFPSAGTPVASARTQVSFRGVPASGLGRVLVSGSRSGAHPGVLRPHSDGQGASFVPSRPFTPGERVTVRAGVRMVGARNGVLSFTLARTRRQRPHYTPDAGGNPGGSQQFHSLPSLSPPTLQVTRRAPGAAPGDIFVAPKAGPGQDGPMITDGGGGLIWTHRVPAGTSAFDFRAQSYEGRPVLTWWEGKVARGEGFGRGVIVDNSYREIARVSAGNGYPADLHEFELTPQGTALMVAYEPVVWGRGVVVDAVVQEVDVKTGLVEFEWHSLGHVDPRESYLRAARGRAFDYFHVNSVQLEGDGNLLVSARNTHAVYEIDHVTGAVLWRLGGKRSTFRMGPGASFVAQHHARRSADGTVTIFDNAAPPRTLAPSRAITLSLDMRRRIATLAHAYTHAPPVTADSQGSAQALPNGDVFVGWGGSSPYVSEYAANGQPLLDAHFVPSGDDSYRAYKLQWTAQPAAPPDVAAARAGGTTTVYASWNGATEVASWQVLAGSTPDALTPAASAPRSSFETAVALPAAQFVAVRALGASGEVLGTSRTIPGG
jgi:hypothetical protein